jgi:hypothetical protein
MIDGLRIPDVMRMVVLHGLCFVLLLGFFLRELLYKLG